MRFLLIFRISTEGNPCTHQPQSTNWQYRKLTKCAHLYKLHFVSFVVRSATLKKPRNGGNFRDRMWECRTAHAHSDIPHLVRASPRHPASVRKCSMWLPVLFRFLVDSLATLGHRLAASGVTSRMLSVIPLLFFRG